MAGETVNALAKELRDFKAKIRKAQDALDKMDSDADKMEEAITALKNAKPEGETNGKAEEDSDPFEL